MYPFPTQTILRQPEVCRITRLSRVTIWRLERKGDFPPRLRLSSNAIGWRESDILAWINNRPEGLASPGQQACPAVRVG